MSSLDVYCLFHFEDKQFYAQMVEVDQALDRNDFAANGYHVDEEKYPRGATNAIGKKGMALACDLQCEVEGIDEEEEDNVAEEEDNFVDLSDDKVGVPRGIESPMEHLTSLNADMEILLHRRNVMTSWSLFPKDLVIKGAEPAPSCSIEET